MSPDSYFITNVWALMPAFYGWLRTTYVFPGCTLMELLVNSLIVSTFIYMILGDVVYD